MTKKDLLASMCCTGLAVGSFAILFPVYHDYANGIKLGVDNSATTLDLTILNNEDDDITEGGSSMIGIRSSSNGTFGSTDVRIVVSTNNETGYSLKMQAEDENLNRNKTLSNGNTPYISPFAETAGGYTEEQIEASSSFNNKWGYKCTSCSKNNSSANTEYLPTPTNPTEIANTTTNSNDIVSVVTFGAKVDNELPSGIYSVPVVFTAVANYVPIVNVGQLEYMQDFANLQTSELEIVKENMVQDQQYVLKDSRDQKEYYIAKLQDGNIWMTQNLDLDLDNTVALTSDDTDLNDGSLSGAYADGYSKDGSDIIYWTPDNSTITSIVTSTGKFDGWSNDNNAVYSADPDGGSKNNLWYANGETYSSDSCYVGNSSQACNYLNSNNTLAPTYFGHIAFTGNGGHGKVGNYYNWSAAIASNDSSSLIASTANDVSSNPQNSICPKGWKLPTISSVAADNIFAELNNIYNGGANDDGSGLIESPVYMVRAGGVYNNTLGNAGYNGVYWSSTVRDANNAYSLGFGSNSVDAASKFNRYYGFSLRCLLK